MKNLISFLCLVTFQLAFGQDTKSQPAAVELKFRVVHGPSSIVSEPLQNFKKEIEMGTQNRVTVSLVSPVTEEDHELAASEQAYKDVKSGNLDMSQVHTYFFALDVPDFNVLDLPFAFDGHEHAFKAVDGNVGTEMFQKLAAKVPVEGLAYTYSGGYRFVATKTKSIEKVDDLKGLELARRMSPADYHLLTGLGVKIDKNNKKAGKDGRVTVYSTYLNSVEEKKTPIVNALNHGLQFTAIIINKKSLARISAQDQKIIKEAAKKAAVLERNLAIQAQTEIENDFAKRNLKLVKFPEAEYQKMKKLSEQMDWSYMKIPSDLYEKIQRTRKQDITSLGN